MTARSLKDRIGVSTHTMPCNGETLWEALDMAHEAGFRALDIVPATYQGNSGYPATRLSVGIDLDEMTPKEQGRLASSVSRFPLRNVHSLHMDLNIASRNKGIARESVRQFMQCADLAVHIGAQSVTFHIGQPNYGERIGDESFVIERDVEFGKRMAEFAEKHDILSGYENLGGFPTLDQMVEIIERVGSPRFGLHLDVGHVWLSEPKEPLAWLRKLGRRIVAVHVHGTYHRPDRTFENHQSLELDDCTDLRGVMAGLRAAEFDGPMILEILAKDIPAYLDMCKRSRDILLEAARQRTDPPPGRERIHPMP